MDDDKIIELFSDFEPEISSSDRFVAKLQKNLEAIEFVKQQNAALRKRNRRAVVIAAVCGFAVGVIQSLLFPLIYDWISGLSISLPDIPASSLAVGIELLPWLIMAGICAITSISAYRIALAGTLLNDE